MPRQLRIEYPGAIYHVMSRGDRREPVFLDDVDRPVCVQHAQAGSPAGRDQDPGLPAPGGVRARQAGRGVPETGFLVHAYLPMRECINGCGIIRSRGGSQRHRKVNQRQQRQLKCRREKRPILWPDPFPIRWRGNLGTRFSACAAWTDDLKKPDGDQELKCTNLWVDPFALTAVLAEGNGQV
jgi:hypothetical protein